jgi:predicted Holliday junction resolvase-like endonuclease
MGETLLGMSTSVLSQRQKKIMEAVRDKRVEWLRLSIKDFGSDVNELLLPPSS